MHCDSCHNNTSRYDTFLDLTLEVHRSVTVPEALRLSTNTDVLDSDNKFLMFQMRNENMRHQKTHSPQHTTSVAAPPEEVWDFGRRWQHQDWAPCHLS